MEKTSNKLVDLSVAFAVEILNLVKFLKSQHETIISNQIGRSGTTKLNSGFYFQTANCFDRNQRNQFCSLKPIISFPLNMTVWSHYAANSALH